MTESEPLVPDNLYEIRKYLDVKDFYNTLLVCKTWSIYKYREKRERIIKKLDLEKQVLKHGFRQKKKLNILLSFEYSGYNIGICVFNGKKYMYRAKNNILNHYNGTPSIPNEIDPYFPSFRIWMDILETSSEIYLVLKFKKQYYIIYNYPECTDVFYVINNTSFLELRNASEEDINTFGNDIYLDNEKLYKSNVVETFYIEELYFSLD